MMKSYLNNPKNSKEVEKLNWDTKIDKLQRKLTKWNARQLTFYGKITLIKSIGISQLIYNASCLEVPDYVIKRVDKILYAFLWGSSKEKVKRCTTTKKHDPRWPRNKSQKGSRSPAVAARPPHKQFYTTPHKHAAYILKIAAAWVV